MCRDAMKQEAITVIAGDIFPAVTKLSAYVQQVLMIDLTVALV